MKDKLIVFQKDREYCFRLGWHLAEEDDFGLVLGEDLSCLKGKEPDEQEAWENWVSHKIARDSDGADHDFGGFYWVTKRQANAVLRAINLQFKQGKRPLADWEKKALAAGWKPPK